MSLLSTMPNFVAGQVVTEADLDALSNALNGIQAAWDPFTPTVSGWTLGNGTVLGASLQVGKTIHFRVRLNLGTTTTTGAGLGIAGLPINPHADYLGAMRWFARDVSAGLVFFGDADMAGAPALTCRATTPFTWAAGDYIAVTGTYEGA